MFGQGNLFAKFGNVHSTGRLQGRVETNVQVLLRHALEDNLFAMVIQRVVFKMNLKQIIAILVTNKRRQFTFNETIWTFKQSRDLLRSLEQRRRMESLHWRTNGKSTAESSISCFSAWKMAAWHSMPSCFRWALRHSRMRPCPGLIWEQNFFSSSPQGLWTDGLSATFSCCCRSWLRSCCRHGWEIRCCGPLADWSAFLGTELMMMESFRTVSLKHAITWAL